MAKTHENILNIISHYRKGKLKAQMTEIKTTDHAKHGKDTEQLELSFGKQFRSFLKT